MPFVRPGLLSRNSETENGENPTRKEGLMNSLPPDDNLLKIFASIGFVTASPNMISVLRRTQRAAAASDITVLLEGETGTGKQVLAHGIHRLDQKRNAFPFVTVHCSTISEALAESELFGHHRGAFSGAV